MPNSVGVPGYFHRPCDIRAARRPFSAGCILRREGAADANGLYSLHMHMLDGVKGRDSGVIILRDGRLLGGGPYFWSVGTYTAATGPGRASSPPISTRRWPTFSPPAVRRAGSHQRVFGDICG